MKFIDHINAARKYYWGSLGKLGLSAIFFGFYGPFPTTGNNALVFSGAVVVLGADVCITLLDTIKSMFSQEGRALFAFNSLKAIAALVEGYALIEVMRDKHLEIKGDTEAADALKGKLIPLFSGILLSKGGLGLTTPELKKLQQLCKNLDPITTATIICAVVIGAGGTIVQGGLVIAFLEAAVAFKAISGVNGTISLVQSGISLASGLWHSHKASIPDPSDYTSLPSVVVSS